MPGRQKSLVGTVVSDKMDKTVVVLVETTSQHRLYRKMIKRSKRYMVHDDRLDAKPGDVVRILETRPLSRHKRWRVAEVLKRGDVAEIAPQEIDREYYGSREEAPADEAGGPATIAPAEPAVEVEMPAAAETVVDAPAGEAEAPPEAAEAPEKEAVAATETTPETARAEETPDAAEPSPSEDEAPAAPAEEEPAAP